MQFDDIEMDDPDLKERFSSWRRVAGVGKHHALRGEEAGVNETEVRGRQGRIANMCLTSGHLHALFYADLQEFVQQPGRSQHFQQRVEDWAAFSLGVYEQSSARLLEQGLQQELANLPKEVVETVYVQPPPPPKSWFQRLLGA
jgi:hypothetical protein